MGRGHHLKFLPSYGLNPGRGHTELQRLVARQEICLIRMGPELLRIMGLAESNLATKGHKFVKLISRNSMPDC